jgi:hypothetical protein
MSTQPDRVNTSNVKRLKHFSPIHLLKTYFAKNHFIIRITPRYCSEWQKFKRILYGNSVRNPLLSVLGTFLIHRVLQHDIQHAPIGYI